MTKKYVGEIRRPTFERAKEHKKEESHMYKHWKHERPELKPRSRAK